MLSGGRRIVKSNAKSTLVATLVGLLVADGCSPSEPNALDKLHKVRMTIKGQAFELWVADQPKVRERGLMLVTRDQMAPLPDGTERGMLFVFDHEQMLSFWMKDTIIPLDIAYVTAADEITSIHTMAPLDERPYQYPSGSPAKYAIEVRANVFIDLGLKAGYRIEIPAAALKGTP